MPAPNQKPPGLNPGWFSQLSRRTQALLLALLMFAFSAGTFFLGIHDMRAGKPLVNMAGKSDWADSLFLSAVAFGIGALLVAAALGWIKPKPQDSETKPGA
jgi:hypothetical protein